MKVWQKLSMIGAAFSLPIAVLLVLMVSGINYHIGFADAEVAGNEYQRSLEGLLEHLSEHRLLAQTLAAADRNGAAEIKETELRVDSDLDSLEAVDRRLGKLLLTAQFGVHRMRGGVDLDRRAEHREITDLHQAHVEDDTVEVEEDPFTQQDVRSVVAEERRLHPDGIPALAEKLLQD